MKYDAKKFLQISSIAVLVLALARCVFPSLAERGLSVSATSTDSVYTQFSDSQAQSRGTWLMGVSVREKEQKGDTTTSVLPFFAMVIERLRTSAENVSLAPQQVSRFLSKDEKPHRVRGVQDYKKAFPDENDVQLEAATSLGVQPIANRDDAKKLSSRLYFAAANPYYTITELHSSIPYIVPRAAVLLHDIGRSFMDSLYVKGLPPHKIVITSVTRTKEDVARLRTHNRNATENSCHMYGTTFDISYKRFRVIGDSTDSSGSKNKKPFTIGDERLKMVLSEVLNDMRQRNRCYVKYELHQGCFHITAR